MFVNIINTYCFGSWLHIMLREEQCVSDELGLQLHLLARMRVYLV